MVNLGTPWVLTVGRRVLLQARDRAVRRFRALRLPLPQQPLLPRGWGVKLWMGKGARNGGVEMRYYGKMYEYFIYMEDFEVVFLV